MTEPVATDAPVAADIPVAAGTEVPHDNGHGNAFPPLDPANFAPQLVWFALTFATLYIVLSRVALPRVSEVIEERHDRIQRDLDSAERLKAETEQALAGYENALADARGNASSIAREKREALNKEIEAEQAKVDSQIAAKVVDAEARISETKAKAMQSVDEIATDTAAAIVKKLLDQDVAAAEIRKAIPTAAGE